MNEIAFFFWFCAKDAYNAPELVKSILAAYGMAEILAVADGAIDRADMEALRGLGVHVIARQASLKKPGRCEDFLGFGYKSLLSTSSANRFIQIDPDSRVHRRAYLPEGNWVGQIFWDTNYSILSTVGCGVIFSRPLLENLIAGLSLERTDFRYRNGVSDDTCMGYHLAKLGYAPRPWTNAEGWPEVNLLPEWSPKLADGNWAITHPWIS